MRNYADLPTWAKNLYTSTAARARKREQDWLTREDYASIWSDRCALTGIPFDTSSPNGRRNRRPYGASIDRIDPNRGYSADNCRLVCIAVNIAMNTWGEGVLYRIAAGLTRDAKAWRSGVGRLPKYVKIAHVTGDGPSYRASRKIGDQRVYTGCFRTPEEALSELAELKNSSRELPEKNSPASRREKIPQ